MCVRARVRACACAVSVRREKRVCACVIRAQVSPNRTSLLHSGKKEKINEERTSLEDTKEAVDVDKNAKKNKGPT